MIIPMKKATLICLREDREKALLALQRCGEFMPVAEGTGEPAGAGDAVSREDALLGRLKPYREKKGLFSQRPVVEEAAFETEDMEAQALEKRAEELVTEQQTVTSQLQAARDRLELLTPWLRLTAAAQELTSTAFTDIFIGYVPAQQQEAVSQAVSRAGGALTLLDEGRDGVAAYALCAVGDTAEVEKALKLSGFVPSSLPFAGGTAKEAEAVQRNTIAQLDERLEMLSLQLEDIGRKGDVLELLSDRRRAEQQREEAPCTVTDMTVYWQGWVRGDRTDRLQKALDRAIKDRYSLLLCDPKPDEEQPSVTQNNRFVTPFETITDMFSRPTAGHLDPNPVMSVWYWLIFGMMVGDVGYGVLMLIGLFLFKKLKKPQGEMAKLVDIMLYAAVPTVFFGVMYGSYFGAAWFPPVFASPLDDPITMLAAALIVGVLHIFSGMIIKMVEDFRAGHPWDAIFDQLTWIVIITGCGLLFLGGGFVMIGGGMAVFGALVVLLSGGRKAKGFGKITGGLLGLYSITGFLSDILSYSRILALALSSGVIGMVMNLLADMVRGGGFNPIMFLLSLIVYFIGHAFNIAMSLLSAYVHDSRLQYIEFFGKFYEGGGQSFKPLTRNMRYVDVRSADDA